ncbi:hypothetical protein GCM10027155_21000 [Acinetobacter apis]|uniref:TnsE C-terminal domain-containing protein n=1 Tax=Acinetobacter apis TaxID=1229165 RepID=A0A217EHN2_9GAMM|nr:hypothetical protein [Acinetobacter apis]SNQ30019.1 hypothetical protein SAMN05444584_1999 [Acinetobacter apis]
MTSIDSFPDDEIERVVYLYSCLKLNTSSESDNILIEVLLVELDAANPNRLNVSENSYNKYDVTFRDLDTVQIGSVWKGQTRIEGRKFSFNNCLKTVNFEFDFSINKPKIIRFDAKIPDSDSNEYYLYNEKIFIPKNKYNANVPFIYYPFLMSKYCILKSNDNIEVIISCIHSLHAFYIPARKDIRGHIINENYSISHIVDLFLDKYEIQHNENGDILSVVMKKNIVKTIGKAAITLLANLALNKNTQEKVLNIRNSLNDIKLDKTGKPYPSRFPSVIPPHSTTMRLTAEGIWLENGKRFLITHVFIVSPIADFPIVARAPITQSDEQVETIDNEKIHRKGRNKKKRNNTRINTQEDPSHERGENRKQTDILVDFTGFDIEIIEEVIETESNTQYIESKEKNKNKDEESSGNRHGNKKNKPQKSENSEKKPNKLDVDDLALIFSSLKSIEAEKDSTKLTKVSCVDEKGNLSDTFSLLQIKPIVKSPIHNTWINDDVGRSLLFLKLELADFHDHLYLIDIKKNNKNNEAFCFFLFMTKEMLNEKNITMICEAIEGKKGTKKWFDICKTNFNQKRAMKHMYTVQSDWIDSFNKIFNTLIKKKKL